MSLTYALPGLSDPADIRIDRFGLSHIRAGSALDAFRVQGFNAARDRLWQLDLWRKRGLGLLAADFGPGFLAQDKAARLFLFRGDLDAEWAAYGPQDTRAIVTAFVGGLNAYIALTAREPERLPPEFAITGTTPAFWAPEDVVRVRSHGLVRNVLSEVARAKVLARGGDHTADDLRKRLSPPYDPFVPEELDAADWPGDLLDLFRLATAQVTFSPERMAARRDEAWAWSKVDAHGVVCRCDGANPPEPSEGSNNWVVGAGRTATGRPILASDPHRIYLNPSLRYAVHLTAPGLDVIGAGEPALPGISIGHNGHAAFSLTIAPMDQEDLFVCQKHPDDPDLVRSGEGWEPIRRVHEAIHVRGGPEVEVTLGFTRHGPVIAEDGSRAFALATVWSEPGSAAYLGSLAYLDVASPETFGKALRHWSAPSVNQLYADRDGRIAWFMAGKAPLRPAHDGLLPVPGDGRFDWSGFHDPADLPSSIDPAQGWFATANEMNLPPGYPAEDRKIGFEWHEPWRANRIAAVLGRQTAHRLSDSQALQTDAFSEPALHIARLVAEIMPCDRAEIAAAQDLLRGFDGILGSDSAGAALIEVLWVRHLRPALIAVLVPDPGARAPILPGDTQSLIQRLQTGLPAGDRERLVADTLGAAWSTCHDLMGDDPSAWAWGKLHRALFAHPLSGIGPGARWDIGPFPIGGAGASPMHAEYRTDTFRITHGASFRMVVDVGAWDASVFINVPGQSGDPRTPHYRDLAGIWANQGYVPMVYSEKAVAAATVTTIRLVPETGA